VLYHRLGLRLHLLTGVLVSSLFMALLAPISGAANLWWMWLDLYRMGLVVGQLFVATQAATFATVPSSSAGRASTLSNEGGDSAAHSAWPSPPPPSLS